jgi:hypothetical protein
MADSLDLRPSVPTWLLDRMTAVVYGVAAVAHFAGSIIAVVAA